MGSFGRLGCAIWSVSLGTFGTVERMPREGVFDAGRWEDAGQFGVTQSGQAAQYGGYDERQPNGALRLCGRRADQHINAGTYDDPETVTCQKPSERSSSRGGSDNWFTASST